MKQRDKKKANAAAETVASLFFPQCNLGRSALKAGRKSRSLHNSGKGCFPAFSCNGACARTPTRWRELHTFSSVIGGGYFWCGEGDAAERWQLWAAPVGYSRCNASTGRLPASPKLKHRENRCPDSESLSLLPIG